MNIETVIGLDREFPVIETETLLAMGASRENLSVQLSRWTKAGKIIQLRRGIYLLNDALRRRDVSLAYLANLLVRPSYVSLEHALSLFELIPERVPLVQSVTTGTPITIDTPVGRFQYRHVKPGWFFGYEESTIGGEPALVAKPEKALLDLVHLTPGELTEERLGEMRLQNLEIVDPEVILAMAERSTGRRLKRAAQRLAAVVRADHADATH